MLDIRKLRRHKKLTQKQFAKLIGVSWITIQNWESNPEKIKLVYLYKIADEFELHPYDLLNNKYDVTFNPNIKIDEENVLKLVRFLSDNMRKLLRYDVYAKCIETTSSTNELILDLNK